MLNFLRTTAAFAAFGVLLAGCSVFQGSRLGETETRAEFQSVPEIISAIGEACPDCSEEAYVAALAAVPAVIEYRDGKDKAEIGASLSLGSGSFDYEASDVGATSPAEVRAAIVDSVGEDTAEAIEDGFPGGLEGFISVLRGGS